MSEAPSKEKRSVGEELFLVHLNRYKEKRAEDFDHDPKPPRKVDMTVGEELWRVHCKRQRGIEEESDSSDSDYDPNEKLSLKRRMKMKDEGDSKPGTRRSARLQKRDASAR